MNRWLTLLGLSDPIHGRAYLGPETLMPLASVLAAVAGFFLMFWRLIVKFFKTIYRKSRGLPEALPPETDPDLSDEQSKDS
jgi:hypothetical protein